MFSQAAGGVPHEPQTGARFCWFPVPPSGPRANGELAGPRLASPGASGRRFGSRPNLRMFAEGRMQPCMRRLDRVQDPKDDAGMRFQAHRPFSVSGSSFSIHFDIGRGTPGVIRSG